MNKASYSRYCTSCSHSKFDPYRGVICGLVNDYPDFKEDCDKLSIDRPALEKIYDEKLSGYGFSKHGRTKTVIDSNYSCTVIPFKPVEESLPVKPSANSVQIGKSKIIFLFYLLVPILILLFTLPMFFIAPLEPLIVIIDLFMIIALTVIVYEYKDKSNSLNINAKGILYKKAIVPWHSILGAVLRESRQHNKAELILITASKADIIIDLVGLEGVPFRLEYAIIFHQARARIKAILSK
ncbi:hypothetical protein [Fulvivirga ligni]|uniref:hypothetical protein n=1 Tax=Fulvivirga ligni TaxID=2904246 RepID=UPI001F3702B4|nr:hypothetical protein [Fulvivirga ligni]UII22299.1 hypothetical protein LVD16_03525 [Fulvivirga ligni]